MNRMPKHPGTRKNVYQNVVCPECGKKITSASNALKHTHNNNGSLIKSMSHAAAHNGKGHSQSKEKTGGRRRRTVRRRRH